MRNLEKRDGINLYLCPMCKGVITCLRLVAGYPTWEVNEEKNRRKMKEDTNSLHRNCFMCGKELKVDDRIIMRTDYQTGLVDPICVTCASLEPVRRMVPRL